MLGCRIVRESRSFDQTYLLIPDLSFRSWWIPSSRCLLKLLKSFIDFDSAMNQLLKYLWKVCIFHVFPWHLFVDNGLCKPAIQKANIVCQIQIKNLHLFKSWLLFFLQSVTENGFAVKGEDDMPIQEALKDHDRVHYFQGITAALVNAIHEDKIDIRSYIPWSRFFLSLLRNFGGNLQTRSY